MTPPQPRTPRVSVVMPVCNGERYIAEAIASVLASAYADLELLVVDDGSTDNSMAEATRAAAGDRRLRIIALPHGGVAAARNAGLEHAQGEFIANLDADDTMFPDRLTRQVAYLDRHPECVAVGCRVLVVDGDGRPVRVGLRFITHEEIDRAHLEGRGGALGNPAATFRKAAALAVGGYHTTLHSTGEDHDLWLRLAEIGRLANLPDVLIRYRIHGSNVSVGPDKDAQRLAVTLDTLKRTFARRGIVDREPTKIKGSPSPGWLRQTDAGLFRYYSGDRLGAVGPALAGWLRRPLHVATRSALWTILTAKPPAIP